MRKWGNSHILQLEKFKFHTRKKNVCLDGGAAWEQVTERWEFCILGAFPCLAVERCSWLVLVLVTVLPQQMLDPPEVPPEVPPHLTLHQIPALEQDFFIFE